MAGETDLGAMLASLAPVLDQTEWGFGTVPKGAPLPEDLTPLGVFEEDEGTSVIAPATDLAAVGVVHDAPYAKISLTVHSALHAVGLTAALSAALAEEGISANVVAAYHHDHVFVPWTRRDDAMRALGALSRRASRPAG